ncbi:hypothetical protein [Streptantibioticus cattleyicolor]|uniref:Uncharacterized protein n=1 Tax=Streptantibioticus cattleyicolor (strain ATCC 35852 / DSM 46488 / JCM 4925 / NBRC 14057 / NRRL 8057) TaxID=1003195 RepID=G8WWK7_STREN|nr:hypothetical protein [Streptantibioticus cattleyicolor]AEW94894.1 hypothetical protein SCATT_25230 [Streptantibioticus cattleyicolor NRRL 8057 = DSM 46488]
MTMPPERVRAAALLTDLGSHDPRLSLSVLDVARLTPLAARWLASGLPDTALHTALTASLPPLIHSPAALLTHRLRTEPPLPPQPPRPHHPSGPLPECTSCRDPLPRNSSAHHCHRCASVPVPLAT